MSETLTGWWEQEFRTLRETEVIGIRWHAQEEARTALAAIIEVAGGEVTVSRAAMHLAEGDRLEVVENPAAGTLTFRLRRTER